MLLVKLDYYQTKKHKCYVSSQALGRMLKFFDQQLISPKRLLLWKLQAHGRPLTNGKLIERKMCKEKKVYKQQG